MLKKALEDGKALIKNNLSTRDVCTVAEICQKLAKFPKFNLYGPEAVSSNENLNAALDYLNQCFRAKGQNYLTACSFGVIYFDLVDFRTATEWHKRALMFSESKSANGNIKQLCFSLLRLGEGSNVYNELIHVLTFIARKRKGVDFLHLLVPKVHGEDYLRRFSKFLIFLQTCPLTAQQVEIAECLKTILFRKDFLTADQFGVAAYNKSTTRHFEYDVKAASLLQRVQMEIESGNVQQNYTYDYCIIVSKDNSGWIQCFLQHQLSIQMVDGDRNFTGFPGIDYDPCSSLLETTIDGINTSRKSILVLSKDFLTKEWCLLKPVITETLQKRTDSLFIILFENCDVPSEIDYKHLSYYFTDEMNIPFEIQYLKLALLENLMIADEDKIRRLLHSISNVSCTCTCSWFENLTLIFMCSQCVIV
ncbi:unnamed protein product [Mytilus coruscus]|uniref:TIR domain-containing protein n=1 Tax=Mytilus coruscus TaxID=42192 RepID=A0A6J8E006_MYTCO|nr:unnamed protein product [Mytilus coruscus]